MDQIEARLSVGGWMVARGSAAEVVRDLLDRLTAEELQALKAEHIPAVQVRKRGCADQERLSRAAARGLRLYDPAAARGLRLYDPAAADVEAEAVLQGMDTDAVREHLRGAD